MQLGLGVASLSVGIVGLLISFIPCLGVFALPFVGLGLVMGLIGLAVGLKNNGAGLGFPIAGSVVSLVGLCIALLWLYVWGAWWKTTSDAITVANQLQKNAQKWQEQRKEEERQLADQKELSKKNLKQIALGLIAFQDANRRFPPAAGNAGPGPGQLSWRVAILPYLGESDLFKQFRANEPWNSAHNLKLLSKRPLVYAPVRGNPGTDETYCQVFTGMNGLFAEKFPGRITSITDGSTNTFLVVEANQPVPWTKPDDLPYNAGGPLPNLGRGLFPDGFHGIMADGGTIRYFRTPYNESDIRALITPNGGEVVNLPP